MASTTTSRRNSKRSRSQLASNNTNNTNSYTMSRGSPNGGGSSSVSAAAAATAPHYSTSGETTYLASANGSALKRIRTPHPHDVLSGRGGGINGHPGNIQFREWVRVRKNDYNLALNKNDKAQVAREVIQLVLEQDPPGRFLQKDPSSVGAVGWWIEVDDDKVMAKTAQALREGAPQIRAEHKDEIQEKRKEEAPRHHRSQTRKTPASVTSTTIASPVSNVPKASWMDGSTYTSSSDLGSDITKPRIEKVVERLRANVEAAAAASQQQQLLVDPSFQAEEEEMERPQKRVRVDYNGYAVHPTDDTPPLLPVPHPPLLDLPPLGIDEGEDSHYPPEPSFSLPPPPLPKRSDATENGEGLKRAHSLAFSDVSLGEWASEEFVNPFGSDELNRLEAIRNSSNNRSNNHNNNSSPTVSRPGVFVTRESSSSSQGDMGGLSSLLTNATNNSTSNNLSSPRWQQTVDSNRSTNGASGVRSRNNSMSNLSSRSLTSVLSDLPDSTITAPPPETDFMEGMKSIYDALHADDDDGGSEETIPVFVYPYRGGTLFNRRLSSSLATRGRDGRQ